MKNNLQLHDIISFIIEHRWEYNFELTKDTQLYNDLKIWGDDAIDILHAFGKKFNVNLSNFHTNKYFPAEGVGFSVKEYKKITIGDLLKAAQEGVLI